MKGVHTGLVLLLTAAIAGVFWAYIHFGADAVLEWKGDLNPIVFFGVLAVLITFGMPATPFILLASTVFPVLIAALGCAATLAVHLLLTWWLAHGILRQPVSALVRKFQKNGNNQKQTRTPKRALRTAIIIKLTPGVPMFVKHFSMALIGLPFYQFVVLAWSVSMAYASGFVFIGQALTEGDWVLMIIGLIIISLAAGGLYWLRTTIREPEEAATGFDSDSVCVEK